MKKCTVCGYVYDEHQLDDPLHITNWNLPDRSTYDVCSEECKQILVDQYELDRRKYLRTNNRHSRDKRDALIKVKELLDHGIPFYDDKMVDLFYDIKEAMGMDDD